MKWVRDNSGRFRERPHYHPDELEQLCEDTMTRFLWGPSRQGGLPGQH